MVFSVILQSAPYDDKTLIAGLFWLGLGILFIAFKKFLKKRSKKDISKYERTIAEVIKINKEKGERNYYNVATIKYRTRNNETIETVLDYRSTLNVLKIGQEITLSYDPKNPSKHFSELREKLEGKMDMGFTFFQTASVVIGILFLINTDYKNLEIVDRYFTALTPAPHYEEKIMATYEKYRDSLVNNNVYLDIFACENYTNRLKEDEFKKQNITECIDRQYDMKLTYDYINDDTLKDALIAMIFEQCNGKKPNVLKQMKLLILSKDTNYYINDTFFTNLETDSLGIFRVDTVINKIFHGKFMYHKDYTDNYSFNWSKSTKISYPDKKTTLE